MKKRISARRITRALVAFIFWAAPGHAQPNCELRSYSVAEVNGVKIDSEDLSAAVAAEQYRLDVQMYEARLRALDALVTEQLLAQEARRQGITMERLLAQTIRGPKGTEAADAKAAVSGLTERLRRAGKVVISADPLRLHVCPDPDRTRGDPRAAVTMVMFSDFECPHCAFVKEAVRTIFAKFSGQVLLGYRDFPLRFHRHAKPAAVASRCAQQQGRFWEYHDLLFANNEQLKDADLVRYAQRLGLKHDKFVSCLHDEQAANAVDRDSLLGQALHVDETPTLFVNGVRMTGAVSVAELERRVVAELRRVADSGQ